MQQSLDRVSIQSRFDHASYKIWDWDGEETPFNEEQVIEYITEKNPYNDDFLYPNNYGRAEFISKALIGEAGNDDQVDEEIKFWRRKDVLVPGSSVQIPSKTYQVHLLKDKPVPKQKVKVIKEDEEGNEYYEDNGDEDDGEEDEEDSLDLDDEENVPKEMIENQDRCIYLGGVLSSRECSDLIESTEVLGYEEIDMEYPKEYRNSKRVLVKSKKLAEILWERILPHLKKSDFRGVKPYGFDNDGIWVPYAINECMRFNSYSRGTFFKPHTDAQFVRNDDEKSIFTILVYLSSSSSGTTLLKKVGETIEDDNLVFDFKKLANINAREGSVAIFNHDLYHAGKKVWYGSKHVVRSEIIFKRIDKDSIYRMDYRNTEEFKRVKKLIDDSYDLEKQGNLTQSTIKYVQAMDMQTSLSHSLKIKSNRKLSFIEETLPEEVFVHIFSYLTDEELCKSIISINSELNVFGRNESMWERRYFKKWGIETSGKSFVDRSVKYEYDTSYEPKKEVETTFHSRENQIINSLQKEIPDWYNNFTSRSNMEKYFNAVLLDLGHHSYKYGLANTNAFLRSLTAIGAPNHPHFYLPSYGFDDILTGDRFSASQYHCSILNFLNSKGLPKKKLLKIFIYQLYKEDLRVKLQEHPLLMAVPPHWNKEYLEKLEKLVFSLEIPAIHFVDSFKLLALYYQKPTSLIISVTPSGSTTLPVIDFESKIEYMDRFETDLFNEYRKYNDSIAYYEYSFKEELSEFLKVAPCSPQQDGQLYTEFVENVEPFEWTSYMISPAQERIDFSEWFYSNVLESVKKSVSSIVHSSLLEQKQIESTLNNIVIVGGLSAVEGVRERLKKDLLEMIGTQLSPSFTFREDKADFSLRTSGIKICVVGQDMDVIGGARIVANLVNFRDVCKHKPQPHSAE